MCLFKSKEKSVWDNFTFAFGKYLSSICHLYWPKCTKEVHPTLGHPDAVESAHSPPVCGHQPQQLLSTLDWKAQARENPMLQKI